MAFTMRITKPGAGNKYYIRKANGGYSNAITGSPKDGACDVLANCVGYAYGRFNEIGGYGACKFLAPVNAEKFIQYKGSCEVGQTPKLGACMVWRKGATLSGSDGAGHVAIVEKVISDTEVYTSESGYGASKPFWNSTRTKGSGNWGCGSGYKFLGFIYNPAVKDEPVVSDNELKVGDVVTFKGTIHYTSSYSGATGKTCKPGKAKVTAKNTKNGTHPYHLVAVSGGGSSVYGWVNISDIEERAETNSGTPVVSDNELKVGDRVKMTANAPVYGRTTKFSSWVYASILYVRQINDDRIVISTLKTGAITGAVDKKYLTKI